MQEVYMKYINLRPYWQPVVIYSNLPVHKYGAR